MGRLRLQHRVAVLLIGLLVAVQLLTLAVVSVVTERSLRAQVDDRLAVGARVLDQALLDRSRMLLATVSVLAEDFGFREAAATGDRGTVESVLANHGARAGADAAVMLGLDGAVMSSWPRDAGPGARAALAPLLEDAARDGVAVELASLDGRPLQLALVPVNAPVQIGWVAVGFALDDAVAASLAGITGLEVALFDETGRLVASSLGGSARTALADQGGVPAAGEFALDGEPWIGLEHALPSRHGEPPRALLLEPLGPALAPLRQLQARVLGFGLLALLAALLAAAWLARGVTRPVAELAEAARALARGEDARLSAPGRDDEVGDLQHAFADMQRGLAEREQRIVHQARHDGLTDLPNRGFALSALQRRLADDGGPLAVLMLDLDRFKEINDTLGHGFGDRVLVELARRLRAAVGPGDLAARLGGDEFILVLPGVDVAEASQRALALASLLDDPMDFDGSQIRIEASFGVAAFPDHASEANALLRRADIALYDAKAGRERVAVYQPGRDERHLRQLTLLRDLRAAIAADAIELAFQPKVAVGSGRVEHVEALARWRHPRLGRIGPDEFIPLAEQSGLIRELSHRVLDRALAQARRWQDEGLALTVAVNISAMDLMDAALPELVSALLARHGVAPSRLVLEITESALMRDAQYAIRVLERLRAAGVRLSIDDFGTGHSSLAQLRRLPVHELKIDRSFVAQMHTEGQDAMIVRSTIELAHTMGLEVIAEGVEDARGLKMLEDFRCDLVQGYIFSPPLPAAEFGEWLRQHAARAAAERTA